MILKYLLIIGVFTISVSLADIRNELEEYTQGLKLQEEGAGTLEVTPIKIKENDLQDLLQEIVEVLRPVAIYLDPFNVTHYPFNIDTPLLKLKGSLDKLNILGFGHFSEDKLSVTENLEFDIGFGLPPIVIDGLYDLDFNVMTLLPLFGNGQFGLGIIGFNASLNMNLVSGTNDILQAQTFNLDFKVNKIDFEIEGLIGGGLLSDFINGVLTDVAADIVMEYKDTIMGIINPIIKNKLNKYMTANNVTLENLKIILKKIIDYIHG